VTYLLLTVVPMSLLGYISYTQYTKSIEEQIGEYMPRFLYQANADIEKHVTELAALPDLLFNSDDMIAILRRDPSAQSRSDLNRDLFALNSYMARTYLSGSNPDVIGVFLLSKNRFFESSKVRYTGFDRDQAIAQYRYDVNVRDKAKVLLPSEVNLRFASGTPYVLIMKQIIDTDNRWVLGTMFIAVQLSFIENILLNFEKNDKADLWVMNRQGEIVYHTDPERIGTFDRDIRKYPILNGSFRTGGAGGKARLVSLTESAELGWVLVHSIPLKYLTEKADLVRNVTVLVFIGIVIVTSLISIVLSLSITRPLKKLSRLMKNAEMGNFQADLSLQTRDEVGSLARSFNSMITTTRELIQTNYRIEIRQKEAELYALQSQINPHFLYNTLEQISMAVEEGESDSVVDMVTLLGRMLRFSVGNKSKSVPLAEEIQHVRDYLTIQKFRFEERLTFDIALNLESGGRELYCPKFILQPIVENSIKHGLESRKALEIQIGIGRELSARSGKHDIVFRIRDNGPGITSERMAELDSALKSETQLDKDSSFGLSNVNARIVLMHGPEYGIQLHSIYGIGTEVIIRIPLLTQPASTAKQKGDERHDGEAV